MTRESKDDTTTSNEKPEPTIETGCDVIDETGAETELTAEFTRNSLLDTHRRRFLKATAVTGMAAGFGGTAATQETTTQQGDNQGDTGYFPEGPTIGVQIVGEGMTLPTGWAIANEEQNRRFITDQTGEVWIHGENGIQDEPFIDISDRIVDLGTGFRGDYKPSLPGYDERGLLGITFHPDFQNNRRFFLHYSAPARPGTPLSFDHTEVIAEFTATEDLNKGNPDSERTIIEFPHPQYNHNAGAIDFGPDGYLYISMGDGGGANDTYLGHVADWYQENEGGNGQDVTGNLLGSFIRIDVDNQEGGKPYAIPDDNPLAGSGDGLGENWAWGFRNPYRWSFNNGVLIVGDLGQDLFEEHDIVTKGGNYGWNVKEGYHCFSTANTGQPPQQCPTRAPNEPPYNGQNLIDPFVEYPHAYQGTSVGIATVGGVVNYGQAVPQLQNSYIYGDWTADPTRENPDGRLFTAVPPQDSPVRRGQTNQDSGGGNQTTGNQTTDNQTTGNQTAGNQTASQGPANVPSTKPSIPNKIPRTSGGWETSAIQVANTDNGYLNHYVLAFGRDQNGDVYILANQRPIPEGNTGVVMKIVPPEQGDDFTGGTTTQTTGNQTNGGNEMTTE
ncbi:PQQ-dependent sugar dehydrogenase [Haladaptatus halobius]|uniref:PQQ-dependent sugar dehydrogenase n=1 Tax=Haladaptatus halobius TaxID=2884875 RepID=UPI001D0A21B4|nr:PQQ-dependent sugar dehydrogenase [Haladaptatus halobius]